MVAAAFTNFNEKEIINQVSSSETSPEITAPETKPAKTVNTYDYAWIIISLLVSLLWFRVNHLPVFPVGLVGGLAVSYMIHRIDQALGKPSYIKLSIPLSVIGCFIGLFLNG